MIPRTTYELIQVLEDYHQRRHDAYQELAAKAKEERAKILLSHLTDMEARMLRMVRDEREHLVSGQSTFLNFGPTVNVKLEEMASCHHGSEPGWEDVLQCALESDAVLLDLIDRLAGSTAATSVQELAARLREMEVTKDRELSKFTRTD